jgi:hypothetical protein
MIVFFYIDYINIIFYGIITVWIKLKLYFWLNKNINKLCWSFCDVDTINVWLSSEIIKKYIFVFIYIF